MRIPDYYCPHCGRFKRRRDVTVVTRTWVFKQQEFQECRHCGCNAVMNTRDEFKKFMDEMECKKSYECTRKEDGDGR